MIDASLVLDGTISAGAATGAAITVTRVSTNVWDLGSARDVGAGNYLDLHVVITEAFTAAGAATLEVALQSCATAGGTYVDIMRSPVYAVASLTAGSGIFRYTFPPFQLNDTGTPNRFIGLNYTVSTGPMTAGKVFAYITGDGDRQLFQAYPIGYNPPH